MNDTLLEQFLLFLAENLEYILIGIAVLFVLLLIVSLLPSKKNKTVKFKGDTSLDKARASMEQTAGHVQALMAGYEGQLVKIEEEAQVKHLKIKELDELIEVRSQEIKMLEENSGDIQETITKISERSAQEATKKAKGGRFRMFIFGFLLGVAICLAGIIARQNWNYLRSLIPAEWLGWF